MTTLRKLLIGLILSLLLALAAAGGGHMPALLGLGPSAVPAAHAVGCDSFPPPPGMDCPQPTPTPTPPPGH